MVGFILFTCLIATVFADLIVNDTLSLNEAKFPKSTSDIFVLNSSVPTADVADLSGPPYVVVSTSNSSASFLAFMMFNSSEMVPLTTSSGTQYVNQTVSKFSWVQGNLTAATSLRFQPLVSASNMQLANLTSGPLVPYVSPSFVTPSVKATLSVWEQTPLLMSYLDPEGTMDETTFLTRLFYLAVSDPHLVEYLHTADTHTSFPAQASIEFTVTNKTGSYSAAEQTLSSTAATVQTPIYSSTSSSSSYVASPTTTTSASSSMSSATSSASATSSSSGSGSGGSTTSSASRVDMFETSKAFLSATSLFTIFVMAISCSLL